MSSAPTAPVQLPSAATLARFFELSLDLVCVVNAGGAITQINPAFRRMLGWARADLVGRPLLEFVHPDDVALARDSLAALIRSQSKGAFESRMSAKDAVHKRIQWQVQADSSGTVYAIGREITPPPPYANGHGTSTKELKPGDSGIRQRAELQLRENEERLRALSEATLEGLVFHELGNILDINVAALNMLGAVHDEVIEHSILEFVPPELHPLAIEKMQQSGRVDPFEIALLRKDGHRLPVEAAVREFNYQGRTVRVIALRDITRRKQSESALTRRAEELAALNRVVQVAASSTNLRTILRTTARELQQLLQLRNCGIGVLDDARQHIVIIADANADPDEASAEGVTIPIQGNPSSERTLATRRSLVIDDAQTDPLTAPIHDLMRARQTTGLMIVPLLRRGDVIGTLGCDITDPARQFLPDEVALVENVAGQLAGAIDNLRLFEEAQRRANELETVVQVSTAASGTLDPQELLQTTVDLTKQNFRLYHAHVYVLNEVKDTLVLAAGAGEVGSAMVAQGWRIPASREQSLVARAARTRQPVVINDVQADAGWLPNPLLPDTRAEMALPLIAGGDVLGVLDVQADAVNRFDDSDTKIMSTLAAQIATALQNARLFQQTEHAVGELNTLTQRLTREGWQDFLKGQRLEQQAYIYDLTQVREVRAAQTSLNGGDAAAEAGAEAGEVSQALSQPLKVQGQTIGQLAVAETFVPEADAEEIMAAVADRLSQHLENLRLAEETRLNLVKQERLSAQLATVAQVSTVASTILERQQLLNEVVNLAQQRFGLYHANVYLFEDVGQTLNLHAASGAVGQQMVEEGRSIPLLLEYSIVARAARERRAVVVNDVLESQSFLPHPLLPNTRAELAVPMLVGERLLGIFDLQADTVGRFADDDVRIQATLAAQVAVALQNATSYAEQTATVARLRELDQLKSSFLANMSHELRTPLNSILGFTDVILEGLDGPLTGQMDNDLKVVQKNGQHLLKLINDILDMAKIEAGRMTISPEPVDLTEVVEEVVETTAPLAREKKLLLNTDVDVVSGLIVEADRMRLRQVLLNLVGNAIKFTDKGSVTVTAENLGEHVLLCVKDTGIGVPPEQVESIFEAFSQIDATTTRKAGGTGLGLPISRHLIELHGGRLWAESSGHSGEGARFFVELPIRIQKHIAPPTGFISEGYSG
ncbi:MAG: GAF domain-containing protein [Anaerolineales bacterium]